MRGSLHVSHAPMPVDDTSKHVHTPHCRLVAVIDGVLSCGGVALAGGFRGVKFADPHTFTAAVLLSSGLLLYSKFLYQQV